MANSWRGVRMIGGIVYLAATSCSSNFFFLPPWWKYLSNQPDPTNGCQIDFNFPSDIWAVGLAVLDILLRVGGFLAVISIMIAGVQYITASGSTDKGTAARKRLTNSLIGLAIILIASASVNFIGKALS